MNKQNNFHHWSRSLNVIHSRLCRCLPKNSLEARYNNPRFDIFYTLQTKKIKIVHCIDSAHDVNFRNWNSRVGSWMESQWWLSLERIQGGKIRNHPQVSCIGELLMILESGFLSCHLYCILFSWIILLSYWILF